MIFGPVKVVKEPLPLELLQIVIETPKPLTIPELIIQYSNQYNASTTIPLAIADAESRFINECNTNGCKYGIGPFQIVQSTFDEQCSGTGTPIMTDVYNAEDNIQCGVKMISEKQYDRWYRYSGDDWFPTLSPEDQREIYEYITLDCSCVGYARSLSTYQPPKVINALDIPVTQTKPLPGAWVLFTYNHVGFVISGSDYSQEITILEENYEGDCIISSRTLNINDKSIRGYYY